MRIWRTPGTFSRQIERGAKETPGRWGERPGSNEAICASQDSQPAPEQSTARLSLQYLTDHSGKGSLSWLQVSRRGDNARYQSPFGDLQVSVQAIDQIDQQALILQLARGDRALQHKRTVAIVHTQLESVRGIGLAQAGLVRGQGVIEQSADSFHPAYPLGLGRCHADRRAHRKVRDGRLSVSMLNGCDRCNILLATVRRAAAQPLQQAAQAEHGQGPAQLAQHP